MQICGKLPSRLYSVNRSLYSRVTKSRVNSRERKGSGSQEGFGGQKVNPVSLASQGPWKEAGSTNPTAFLTSLTLLSKPCTCPWISLLQPRAQRPDDTDSFLKVPSIWKSRSILSSLHLCQSNHIPKHGATWMIFWLGNWKYLRIQYEILFRNVQYS